MRGFGPRRDQGSGDNHDLYAFDEHLAGGGAHPARNPGDVARGIGFEWPLRGCVLGRLLMAESAPHRATCDGATFA